MNSGAMHQYLIILTQCIGFPMYINHEVLTLGRASPSCLANGDLNFEISSTSW